MSITLSPTSHPNFKVVDPLPLPFLPDSDFHKRNRYDMYKNVDADYYGYRDDEDGLLVDLEAKQEAIGIVLKTFFSSSSPVSHIGLVALEEALREDGGKRKRTSGEDGDRKAKIAKMFELEVDKVDKEEEEEGGASSSSKANAEEEKRKKESLFRSHVPVPSQQDIQKFLLDKKKQMLLEKYASEDLTAAEKETRELTGRS